MSILSDADVRRSLGNWLNIEPFDPELLQAASYDLTLGDKFLRFSDNINVIRPWEPQNLWTNEEVPEGGYFVLGAGEFALGTTRERLSLSRKVTAEIWGKSSLGRLGLSVHVTAGFVDPGFEGSITLEFYNVSPVPILLQPGMAVCQVVFGLTWSEATVGYDGKYQKQENVTPSRYHLNYME